MDVTSTYKFARISARKARDVAREIQGLPVSEALDLLMFTPRKGADLFQKTMKAAIADAENNFELDIDGLVVKEAIVGEGPTFKRFKPRARGSAAGIRKRTAHIRVTLTDEWEEKEKTQKFHVSESRAGSGSSKKKGKSKKPAAAAAAKTESKPVEMDKGQIYDKAPDDADDLTEITGVGPKIAETLNKEGIYTFEQIANWTKSNVETFDELLSFKGRIDRDDWIEKAKELHAAQQD